MQSSPRWILGCLLSLLVLGFGGAMILFMALSSMNSAPTQDQLVEIELESAGQAVDKIAVIKVSGVIASESPNGGVTGYVLKALERATEDTKVRVILMEIDSPGGGVTDSDRIHHAVEEAKKSGKKVYVLFGNICASGGYYIAVAADEIWSRPTSITGSIGVIVPSLSAEGLLERLGVVDQSVSSGNNKQILGVTKDMNTEQKALVQGVVDAMYNRFVRLVAVGRGLSETVVKPLADGRLYAAEQALEVQLIDKIGYRDELIAAIRAESKVPLSVVRYQGQQSLIEIIVGSQVKIMLDRILGPRVTSPLAPSYLLVR